ncbi:hypothetical protein ZIOFF_068969 [Zingiber officinale]|uniref:Uncharacterized protein n=1 Tax=Zingiber officinale TaxID=94328 RepID=A0A8J5BG62_ZINOF|nr:hypothetical protein ZIOFF_068969 [Zingiber officinale]
MGGKQSCACFGTSRVRESEVDWEPRSTRKIRPSDDDRGYFWFSEPDVDNKASDFIARFYASRYTEADQQAIRIKSLGPAFVQLQGLKEESGSLSISLVQQLIAKRVSKFLYTEVTFIPQTASVPIARK